jgi:membrane protease YdiL (CAAX protease family)
LKTNFYFKTLSLIIIVFAAILVSNLVLLGIASLFGISIESETDLIALIKDQQNIGYVKSYIALNHILIFIISPIVFLSIFYRKRIISYLSLNHFHPSLLLLFPMALFSLYPVMGYLSFYIDQIDLPDFLDKMDKSSMESLGELLKMNSFQDLLVNIIVIGIIPGIGEELLFRGIIQKEFTSKLINPHVAIFITAVIFSAFHFQVAGFIPKLIIGLVLGYAYFLSGSLILAMVIHSLNNIFLTTSLFAAGGKIETQTAPTENLPVVVVLFSLIIFATLFYMILSITKTNIQQDE